MSERRSGALKVAVVGGGKMGAAILGGWIAATDGMAATLFPQNFVVVNPGEARREELARDYGVECLADASSLSEADICVVAVKPQKMGEVLPVLASRPFIKDCLVISIAAGWSTERIESFLPFGVRVVRVMPNTPLLVGAGASTLCGGAQATDEDVALVHQLFSALGKAWVVDEGSMDATGAVSGSGPAYVAALIEALGQGALATGLDEAFGEALALQTVYGTAKLMIDRDQSATRTRVDVCSPGGTTLAALSAMEEGGFSASIVSGVEAAVQRSKELGSL